MLRGHYGRAVQRLILAGDTLTLDSLVRSVDAARQRASNALSDYDAHVCTEEDVLHAHVQLWFLMLAVIRQPRD